MNRFAIVSSFFLLCASANATTIYNESFASGSALSADPLVNYSAIQPYWQASSNNNNGVVVQNTNNVFGTTYNGFINAASGGSGYFLFEGTAQNTTTGNTLFVSSGITVSQNTNYTLSFQLTNAGPTSAPSSIPAQITLQANGVSLLSGVTALGYYSDGVSGDQWQTYSATWNSGSNTSLALALLDTQTQGNGNDFGID
jgi:hypothetical protein